MKSHPDAASRSAAEVVTQLPVLSRLGLLRFERLNEPSWALLFLDPACERQLGLPATTLCALLDAPYASLMEPEARHRLHEQIQQQLVKRPHYQVSYKLHTPNGVLTMLEFGEAFQQHGRQLLHGYLMVEERAESAERSEQLLDLESQNLRLKASLDLYQRSQDDHLQHLLRSRTQQNLIVRLARHRYLSSDPLLEAAQLITQAACEAYGTARAGIWRLLDDQRLEAVTVYRRDLDQYEKPQSIDASRYPAYLEAVHSGRAIDAHNAQRDPRTQELYKDYLKPLGVNALLDATIRIGGEVVGVLCLEHAGENRMWQSDEIAFAGELADQYAQVLMNHERRNVSSALHLFQRAVEQSASAFLLIDRDGVVEKGESIAAQVLHMLDKPLFVDNQLINITGSIGLASAPQHGCDPQTLMKYAGLALHKAKANGKHQVQVFTEALTAEASYKLFVESNLRRALAQNELAVHYQPKLCLRSGQLLGLEALLRWQHPEKGMIRPDRFISVAEETGLIVPIGKWVIREACRQARELAEAGLGELQIAINLSPKQFTDPDLVGSIAAILHEENIPASQLELELTESLLLDATDDTRQQLERLKSLGLTLAMDDFGTGYSSLSYLKKFPIDVIKIDRSFIKDIPDSQDDMEITSAVIAMAHNLKLKVVAEGVESAEQLAFLRRNRCDIGQGYLFDRPIPSDLLNTSLLRYPCRTLH
ncbi:diguanylate cyclase [Pseudomonas aeruginosa]|uniref:sensor domain-containing phosphodiesterase n=1 Tax=Pseudomonas aeruginosa TaxID=287 RepID=UPI00071C17C6|nr:sensor domain-containing phosphodiesterase [Pseudomonas aeruginosa]KSC71646.1 diguanylate cyclase [Pseudomonas aeruginosa]KSC91151.1 diguanylate cyclase [Pseudomonas aeruginosa]